MIEKNQNDLIIDNLSLSFEKNKIIKNISFGIEKSDILVLIGPSGSGKTSLIRCITGLESPDDGEITISGKNIFGNNINIPTEKRDIGIVFQDFTLFPHMNVVENISYGIKKDQNNNSRPKGLSVLELMLLCGIYHLRDRYPDELSGGEQQRVALARSLAPNPKLLLMDEPFSNLDASFRMQLRSEVKRILK